MKTIKSLALTTLLALTGSALLRAEPADGWTRLLAGNARFVSGQPQHPHQDAQRRHESAAGQKPFAVVIMVAIPP